MITSKQLAVALDKHKAAATRAVQQFMDAEDLEVITREIMLEGIEFQEFIISFRKQEESAEYVREAERLEKFKAETTHKFDADLPKY